MTTPTTLRTTFIVSAVLVVLARPELPSPSSPLTVRFHSYPLSSLTKLLLTFDFPDAKQARDLVNVLREAKQYIDPKLEEMVRYGGHGGGGRWGGGGRGRGGYGGGRRGR